MYQITLLKSGFGFKSTVPDQHSGSEAAVCTDGGAGGEVRLLLSDLFYALYSDRAWRDRMPDHRAVVCQKWQIRVLPTKRRRRCGRFIRLPISLAVVCPLLAVCLSFDCRLIVLSPPSAYRVFSRARPAADFAAVYFRIFRFCFIYNLPVFSARRIAGDTPKPHRCCMGKIIENILPAHFLLAVL